MGLGDFLFDLHLRLINFQMETTSNIITTSMNIEDTINNLTFEDVLKGIKDITIKLGKFAYEKGVPYLQKEIAASKELQNRIDVAIEGCDDKKLILIAVYDERSYCRNKAEQLVNERGLEYELLEEKQRCQSIIEKIQNSNKEQLEKIVSSNTNSYFTNLAKKELMNRS